MASGLLERRVRLLPGVLSCSVGDDVVTVLLHPNVDVGEFEATARPIVAGLGGGRHLRVLGGAPMAVAGRRRQVLTVLRETAPITAIVAAGALVVGVLVGSSTSGRLPAVLPPAPEVQIIAPPTPATVVALPKTNVRARQAARRSAAAATASALLASVGLEASPDLTGFDVAGFALAPGTGPAGTAVAPVAAPVTPPVEPAVAPAPVEPVAAEPVAAPTPPAPPQVSENPRTTDVAAATRAKRGGSPKAETTTFSTSSTRTDTKGGKASPSTGPSLAGSSSPPPPPGWGKGGHPVHDHPVPGKARGRG